MAIQSLQRRRRRLQCSGVPPIDRARGVIEIWTRLFAKNSRKDRQKDRHIHTGSIRQTWIHHQLHHNDNESSCKHCLSYEFIWIRRTRDYILLDVYYCVLFSSRVRIRIEVRTRFNVWLVVIVTLPSRHTPAVQVTSVMAEAYVDLLRSC